MASLRVPAPMPVPTSTIANRRSVHMPLSSHGMPKAPRALSPDRPHRFSALILPNSSAESSPMAQSSPGPMSPPMSAKSFGTLIDSAPSTPAYSPRQLGEEWGHPQLTILQPISSSSAPSSPTEPVWQMMAPLKQPFNINPAHEDRIIARPKLLSTATEPIVLSKPVKRTKSAATARATIDVADSTRTTIEEETLRKEADAQARKLVKEDEVIAKSQETVRPEPSPKTETAPLGKFATRMKSLLKRNTNKKKKGKKKPHQEFDRMEDAHWSEM